MYFVQKIVLTKYVHSAILIMYKVQNKKGSEQMNEEKKKALARLAETVSQLDKVSFNYILGVADGMAISKKQAELDKQIAMCGSVK